MPRPVSIPGRAGAALLAVLCLLAAASPGRTAAQGAGVNLLQNSDFDRFDGSTPQAWAVASLLAYGPAEPAPGNRALSLSLQSGNGFSAQVRQDAALPTGPGTYLVTLRAQSTAEVALDVMVEWLSADGLLVSRPLVTAWPPASCDGWNCHAVEVAEAPPAAARCVRVRVTASTAHAGPVDLLLDDARLTFVPAPGTPPPVPGGCPAPAPPATPTATPTATATPPPGTPTPEPEEPLPALPAWTVANASFEDVEAGVPRGWRTYGGALERSAAYAVDGGYSARLAGSTSSTKWAYQVVAVRGGAYYELSAFALVAGGPAAAAYLRISWYPTADGSGRLLGSVDSLERARGADDGFVSLTTGPVAAPDAARSARLRLMLAPGAAGPATAYFDAVTFGEAAAPDDPPPDRDSEDGGRSQAGVGRLDPTALPPSGYAVKVNEVAFHPATEAGEDERGLEWVELFNPGPEPVSLAGWSLADNARRTFLPAVTLEPGQFLVVAASHRVPERYPAAAGLAVVLEGTIGNGLANAGDRVLLVDAAGGLVDALSYGRDDGVFAVPPPVAGHASLERRPAGRDSDEAEDFVANGRPTPGYGLTEALRAVEAAGGAAAASPPGVLAYRFTEQGAAPSFLGYVVGAAVLLPLLILAAARLRERGRR